MAAALWLAAAAGEARAQSDPREAEARKECLAGRTQRGIDLLAALFTETRDPNYIFNQARCYQQNNRPEEAISRFREYLRKVPDLPAAERVEVQRHIGECEAMKAERLAADRPASAARPAGDLELRAQVARDEDQRARRLRVAGISIAAAGAGAVVFGAVMSWRTDQLEREFQEKHVSSGGGFFDRKAYNSGERAELMQWIGYAVGAVAVGTGGIFYYLGHREREGTRSIAVAPHLTRGGAGANLSWRF
jgi:hypothetical protein